MSEHNHHHCHENEHCHVQESNCTGCSCGCGHCHENGEENGSLLLLRLGAALALLVAALLSKCIPLYFIAYIIAGFDVVIGAFKRIIKGGFLDENFLMTVASLGAFAIGEYAEGVAVMIFYGFGEFIQDKAVDKSNDSITKLLRMRPDHAEVIRNGKVVTVSPNEVKIGETITVAPGERVPLDGMLVSEAAVLDTSALTGESMPVTMKSEEEILSGCINMKSQIQIQVTHTLEDSSTERIFRMVTEARANKSTSEKFISRFAKVYTPVVVILALILAFVPPVFVGHLSAWIHKGLVFLVASCPCALVLSVPLTFFAGMGLGSKNGILFKGSAYMEQFSKVKTIAFDKTGTLTKGELEITDLLTAEGISTEELMEIAAAAESSSDHPIGKAIAAKGSSLIASDFEELVGGISAKVNGSEIIAGNTALTGIENTKQGTAVHIIKDKKYLGSIYLSDTIRPESKDAILSLNRKQINTAMITGDNSTAAQKIADELGIKTVHSQILPEEKLNIIKNFKGITAFVGDGINDSPALSGADIGIAMGGMGREAAMEAADVVIMDDNPNKVPLAVQISKKVYNTAVFNITFALSFKSIVLILGALGIANMWLAVFADVGVALIAVLIAVLRSRNV